MPWVPISSPTGVLATLSGVVAFFFWLEKATAWKFLQFIPPLIFIYLAPMILSNNIQQQRQSTAFLRRLSYVQ